MGRDIIEGNEVSRNDGDGIQLGERPATIRNNTITRNKGSGISRTAKGVPKWFDTGRGRIAIGVIIGLILLILAALLRHAAPDFFRQA